MNRMIPLAAIVALAVAGAAWWFTQSGTSNDVTLIADASDGTAIASDVTDTAADDIPPMILGNPDAAVKVVEYASFTCPHCRAFHENVFGQIQANYIDTGKISFENREVYFDRYGLWATMLARCDGNPERYFGITDLIYKRQREWTQGESDAQVIENLKRIGRVAGLTNDVMEACLQDQAMAEALVARFQAQATQDEVNSTPTFFVNGEKYSNMSYEDFARILDEALGQ